MWVFSGSKKIKLHCYKNSKQLRIYCNKVNEQSSNSVTPLIKGGDEFSQNWQKEEEMWDFCKTMDVGEERDSVKKRGNAWFFNFFEYSGLETFLPNKMLDTVLRIGAGAAF